MQVDFVVVNPQGKAAKCFLFDKTTLGGVLYLFTDGSKWHGTYTRSTSRHQESLDKGEIITGEIELDINTLYMDFFSKFR